jgi:hypothetical protein
MEYLFIWLGLIAIMVLCLHLIHVWVIRKEKARYDEAISKCPYMSKMR